MVLSKRIKQQKSKCQLRPTHQYGDKKVQQIKLEAYPVHHYTTNPKLLLELGHVVVLWQGKEALTHSHHNRDMTTNNVLINIPSS